MTSSRPAASLLFAHRPDYTSGVTVHEGVLSGGDESSAATNVPYPTLRRRHRQCSADSSIAEEGSCPPSPSPSSPGGGGHHHQPSNLRPRSRRTLSYSSSDPSLSDCSGGRDVPSSKQRLLQLSLSRERLKDLMSASVIDWEEVRRAQMEHYDRCYQLTTPARAKGGDEDVAKEKSGVANGQNRIYGRRAGAAGGGRLRRPRSCAARMGGTLSRSMERFEYALLQGSPPNGGGSGRGGGGGVGCDTQKPSPNASWDLDDRGRGEKLAAPAFLSSASLASFMVDWEQIRRAQMKSNKINFDYNMGLARDIEQGDGGSFSSSGRRGSMGTMERMGSVNVNGRARGRIRKVRSYHGRGESGFRTGLVGSMERFERALLGDENAPPARAVGGGCVVPRPAGKRRRSPRHNRNASWDDISETAPLETVYTVAGRGSASPMWESNTSEGSGTGLMMGSRTSSPSYFPIGVGVGVGVSSGAGSVMDRLSTPSPGLGGDGGSTAALASPGAAAATRKYITAPSLREMGILPPSPAKSPV